MNNRLDRVPTRLATLGEGPYWDHEHQTLYWIDIKDKKLLAYRSGEGERELASFDRFPGSVVPRAGGGMMLAMQDGFYSFDPGSGRAVKRSEPEAHAAGNRFNDGKCDSRGRFWAGTMSMSGETGAGTLYCLETDFRVRAVIPEVSISNGIGWSPDNASMYFVDSSTKRVSAFDYDLEAGMPHNRRTIVSLSEDDGYPDGMTVDAEGMIWLAHWGGGKVTRWNPVSGELLETLRLPVSNVTSCTFGGEAWDTLFITTAKEGLSGQALQEQPLAGALFSCKPGVKGLPVHAFGG